MCKLSWILAVLAIASIQFRTSTAEAEPKAEAKAEAHYNQDTDGTLGSSFRSNAGLYQDQQLGSLGQFGTVGQLRSNSHLRSTQLANSHFGNSQLRNGQFGTNQFGSGHFGTSQFGNNQLARFGSSQLGSGRFGNTGFSTSRFGSNNLGTRQFGNNQFGTSQFRTGQFGNSRFGNNRFGSNQLGGVNQYGVSQRGVNMLRGGLQPDIAILDHRSENDGLGQYSFGYETENGIQHQESGQPVGLGSYAVSGSYSYTSPEGVPVTVSYVADENGFQVDSPNVPAMPEHSRLQVEAAQQARLAGIPLQTGFEDSNFQRSNYLNSNSNLLNLVNRNRNFVGTNTRNFGFNSNGALGLSGTNLRNQFGATSSLHGRNFDSQRLNSQFGSGALHQQRYN